MRTVTIAGAAYAIEPQVVRALAAAVKADREQPMIPLRAPHALGGCTKCGTVCTGHDHAAVIAYCACCVTYHEMQRRPSPGRGRARAADIGVHVFAPLIETMRTLTKPEASAAA